MAKKRTTKKSAPSSNHTDEQARALKALALAQGAAAALVPFKTAAGILTDDTAGEHDDVIAAIDEIAETCFNGGLDIGDAICEQFPTLNRRDKRVEALWTLAVQEGHAQHLAGFALGVAWGRLQGGAR
jgi:hypothetical protein